MSGSKKDEKIKSKEEEEKKERKNAEEKQKEEKKGSEKSGEKPCEKELEEKNKVIKELEDKYMRALAEMDNARKRAAKEKMDTLKYAKREAIDIFLPVLDNLDRAVHATAVTDNLSSMKKGIEMVIKQFEDILKETGAKEIETKGIFDPELHHVIGREEKSGKKEGEILEVYQKGYIIDGSIIRPARVKVAVKGSAEKEEKNGSGKEDKG